MNCFACKKDCVMKTEKHMDKTPCMACKYAEDVPGWLCKGCLGNENICHFVEKTT